MFHRLVYKTPLKNREHQVWQSSGHKSRYERQDREGGTDESLAAKTTDLYLQGKDLSELIEFCSNAAASDDAKIAQALSIAKKEIPKSKKCIQLRTLLLEWGFRKPKVGSLTEDLPHIERVCIDYTTKPNYHIVVHTSNISYLR